MPRKRRRKPNIGALCLDMFDVAVNYDLTKGEKEFARRLGVSEDIIRDVLDLAGRREFSWGGIDSKKFLARLNELVHPREPLTENELAQLWCRTYSPNPEVIGLIPSLAAVAPVFFATNGNHVDTSWAQAQGITVGPCVRRVLCAQALRAKKPDTDFFRRMRVLIRRSLCRRIGYDQLMLVDDDRKNVEAARNLGMKAIWYTGPASITAALQCFSKQ